MNRTLFAGLSVALSLSAASVNAQDTLTLGQARSPQRAVTVTSAAPEPDWFSKSIDIDFRGLSLVDAVKKILDAAKVKYDKIDVSFDAPKTKFDLKAKDINARDALAAMARFGGAQAYVSQEDGKTVIELRKRTNETALLPTSPFGGGFTLNAPGASAFSGFNGLPSRISERYKDLPEKKLDLDVREGSVADVLKIIAQQTGIAYELEGGLKSDAKLTLSMNDATLGSALDMIARLLNAGWKSEKKDGKVKVTFSKKIARNQDMIFTTPPSTARTLVPAPAMPSLGSTLFRSALPDTRVSLDKKKTDPRELLRDVLKQANLAYAIGDDLPSEPKSFTFENVPLTTALNMICESIGASWTTERGTDGKPVVRIGKAGRAPRTTSYDSLVQRYFGTRGERL